MMDTKSHLFQEYFLCLFKIIWLFELVFILFDVGNELLDGFFGGCWVHSIVLGRQIYPIILKLHLTFMIHMHEEHPNNPIIWEKKNHNWKDEWNDVR